MSYLFDRLLLFIFSFFVGICVIFVLLSILGFLPDFDPLLWLTQVQETTGNFLTVIIVGLLLILISIRLIYVSIRNEVRRPLSVDQRTDLGDIRISMETLRNLALKSASRVKGAQDFKVKVQHSTAGLEIIVKIFVDGERSITVITEEVQQSVKEYIEDITGIPVASVSVFVANLVHEPTLRSRVE